MDRLGVGEAARRRRTGPARIWALLMVGVGGVLLAACLVDTDQRCPTSYVYAEKLGACTCPPNSIIADGLCKACGANEEAVGKECKCKAGTARNPAGLCEVVTAGPGTACTTAASCTDPANAHCQVPMGQPAGYCTSTGCTSNAACAAGWTCATWTAAPYCRRPPTGLGKTCASAADCAGLDASYCEAFQSHKCVVTGCMLSPDDCGVGLECCDLASVGLPLKMCVGAGTCPTKQP
jgi:hypothetical protein